MFTLENQWEETSKCGATLFDSCLYKPWLVEQSFASFVSLLMLSPFLSLSLSLSLFLVRHIFNERKHKFWMLDATTRSVWKKKETNEPPSFCLYSSYSRRTNIYIFFFPQRSNRSSSLNEEHCVFVHRFVQFVRFLAIIHSFIRTNPRIERHVYFYSNIKDKETVLNINNHSMTTTHKGKEEKDLSWIF
jgi:hypothetical protein